MSAQCLMLAPGRHCCSECIAADVACLCVFVVADTSTVSAGDLENIIEMETPPQSPGLFTSSETQPLMSSAAVSAASDGRRCSIIVSADTDSDNVVDNVPPSVTAAAAVDDSAMSKSRTAEPIDRHSPLSSLPSSPRADSPVAAAAFSVCPLRLGGKTKLTSSVDSDEAAGRSTAAMTAEAFIQRQQEQVGRIAEYNKRSSLIDEAQLAAVVSHVITFLSLSFYLTSRSNRLHYRSCPSVCLSVRLSVRQLVCPSVYGITRRDTMYSHTRLGHLSGL